MPKEKISNEQAIEKLDQLLTDWQELVLILKKEQEDLHRDFIKALDEEKMKKVLDRLKNIEN